MMKTKKQILKLSFLFLVGLIISCSDSDDTNDNPDEVVLTSTNFMDIAMIERYYYEVRIEEILMRIDSLETVINIGQGDIETATILLMQAEEDKEDEEDKLQSVSSVLTNIDREWPPPVDPCQGATCIFNEVKYILEDRFSRIQAIRFYTLAGEALGTNNDNFVPLPNYNNIYYEEVNFNGYTGEIIIEMETVDNEILTTSGGIY